MALLLASLLAWRVLLPIAPDAPLSPTGVQPVALTPVPTATHPPPRLAVFVLAGQSNMIPPGRELEVPAEPADTGLVLAALRWWMVPGAAPGTVRAQAGPGLGFARAVVRAGVPRVGLVGCALGGSNITAWQKGQALYDDCLAAVRAIGLPVAGVLFAQGEVDARSDGYQPPDGTVLAPDLWGDCFGHFVVDFRADTGQPDLPVVYARLAHSAADVHGNWAAVQAQQDAVRIPGVAMVDPEPVELADQVHWTDEGYAAVGEKMAAAWLALRH